MPKFKTMYFYLATSCQLKEAAHLLKISIDKLLDKIYGVKPFRGEELPQLFYAFFEKRFTFNQMLDYGE